MKKLKKSNDWKPLYIKIMSLSSMEERIVLARQKEVCSASVWHQIITNTHSIKTKTNIPYYQRFQKITKNWTKDNDVAPRNANFQIYDDPHKGLCFGIDALNLIQNEKNIRTLLRNSIIPIVIASKKEKNESFDILSELDSYKYSHFSDVLPGNNRYEATSKIDAYTFVEFDHHKYFFLREQMFNALESYLTFEAARIVVDTGRTSQSQPNIQQLPKSTQTGLRLTQTQKMYLFAALYGSHNSSFNKKKPSVVSSAEKQKDLLQRATQLINKWVEDFGINVTPLIEIVDGENAITSFFAILRHQLETSKGKDNDEYALDILDAIT